MGVICWIPQKKTQKNHLKSTIASSQWLRPVRNAAPSFSDPTVDSLALNSRKHQAWRRVESWGGGYFRKHLELLVESWIKPIFKSWIKSIFKSLTPSEIFEIHGVLLSPADDTNLHRLVVQDLAQWHIVPLASAPSQQALHNDSADSQFMDFDGFWSPPYWLIYLYNSPPVASPGLERTAQCVFTHGGSLVVHLLIRCSFGKPKITGSSPGRSPMSHQASRTYLGMPPSICRVGERSGQITTMPTSESSLCLGSWLTPMRAYPKHLPHQGRILP